MSQAGQEQLHGAVDSGGSYLGGRSRNAFSVAPRFARIFSRTEDNVASTRSLSFGGRSRTLLPARRPGPQ